MNNSLNNAVYKIEPALSLLYIFNYGSVELRDILMNERVIWQDPMRQPNMKIIVDLSQATEVSFELDDLRTQVDLNMRMLNQGYALEPTAMIGRYDYDITLGEIIEMQMQRHVPVNMASFLTLREAVNWLGLTEAYDQIVQIRRSLQQKVHDSTQTQDV